MTAAAIVAVSCNTGKIKLDGRLIGCDNTLLLLESAAPAASGRIVDSVRTDEKDISKSRSKAPTTPLRSTTSTATVTVFRCFWQPVTV